MIRKEVEGDEGMEQQRLEKGLFNFTAGIVGVFTLILALNLLSFKPTAKANSKTARQPASAKQAIGETELERYSPANDTEFTALAKEIELPCLSDGLVHNLTSSLNRLRIGSQLCQPESEINESLIVNKTNGFMATVFYLNSTRFTTDLIDLSPGENHIHISHHLENGQKLISEVVVTH